MPDPVHDTPATQPFSTSTQSPGPARPAQAPAGHPPVAVPKIGVLLANLGTPDHHGYWPMRRYLKQFLSDRRVIDVNRLLWWPLLNLVILTKRPFSSGAAYRAIWNHDQDESPLMTITKAQCAAVRDRLSDRYGDRVVVDFCMRYGNPATPDRIAALQAQGCTRIVFFPLYPQYAAPTTATANDEAFRALMTLRWQPSIRTTPAYFEHPLYIKALADSLAAHLDTRAARGEPAPDAIVASYHGVPKRYLLEGDPYHCQCQKTTRLLREHLGWSPEFLEVAFQSRFGREEWVRPYTVERVAELARAGKTDIVVFAPGFAADCVETLEEIEGEIKHAFLAAGGRRFDYVPCLNDSPAHIDLLVDVVAQDLQGWIDPLGTAAPLHAAVGA